MSEKLEPTVGSWVHISNRHSESIAKIDRVTKTQFIVGSYRFRILDSYLVGGDAWSVKRAKVITEERANELKAQFTLKQNGYQAKNHIEASIRTLSDENAIKVMEFIKSLG